MQNVDSTVIATALPTMARAFGAEPVRMNVALTSYLLSLAVFIPASGWMADRFGARNVFRIAIAVFTLGSVLCGAAQSLPALVLFRVLQGIGGAMMVPVGRLLLLRNVPKSELVAAMAWLTTPALIGPVVGPPLGGFITTYFSWRLIFDINIPIGIAGIILVTVFVDDVREPTEARFDWVGFAVSGVGPVLPDVRLRDRRARRGPGAGSRSPCWASGVLAALGYAVHALRHPAPLIDFTLLRYRTFLVSVTAGTLFRIGVGAIPFLMPMMLQLDLRPQPAAERPHHLRQFGRRAGDEAGVDDGAAAARLSRHAAGQRRARRPCCSALCAAFRPAWPMAAIYAGAAGRRVLPLAAVHRLQRAGLWRNPARPHERRHQPLQHHPAGVADARHLDRRRRAHRGHGASTAMRRRNWGISALPSWWWRCFRWLPRRCRC